MWKCLLVGALGGLFAYLAAHPQVQNEQQVTTVSGVLSRVAAIGGETTGWAIRFESETTVEGRRLRSIEVSYKAGELAKFADKHVRAAGKTVTRRGVERGEWLVLEISSIEEIKPN